MLVLGFGRTVERSWLLRRFLNRCRPVEDCMPDADLVFFRCSRQFYVCTLATTRPSSIGTPLGGIFTFAQAPSSPRHERQRRQRQTIVCVRVASGIVLRELASTRGSSNLRRFGGARDCFLAVRQGYPRRRWARRLRSLTRARWVVDPCSCLWLLTRPTCYMPVCVEEAHPTHLHGSHAHRWRRYRLVLFVEHLCGVRSRRNLAPR